MAKPKKRFPKKETLHYVYSRHINTEIPIETLIEREVPQFLEQMPGMIRIFAEYVSRKAERNLVDYDDLLLFWAMMLEQSPALADRIAGLYDHILVDEYQDTNLLQARILRGMCRTHRNITVVGDDAQSIYSFRGASFRNILDFPKQFEGTQVVALEQNYRSTQPILDTTNTLISRALERFTKKLWTRAHGASRRGSSRRATSSSRRASSSIAFSSCTRRACRFARWRCSCAPATCRPTSRSSSRTATSRSRSGAASSSSRRRT